MPSLQRPPCAHNSAPQQPITAPLPDGLPALADALARALDGLTLAAGRAHIEGRHALADRLGGLLAKVKAAVPADLATPVAAIEQALADFGLAQDGLCPTCGDALQEFGGEAYCPTCVRYGLG